MDDGKIIAEGLEMAEFFTGNDPEVIDLSTSYDDFKIRKADKKIWMVTDDRHKKPVASFMRSRDDAERFVNFFKNAIRLSKVIKALFRENQRLSLELTYRQDRINALEERIAELEGDG